jgi:hypothetical protein
VGFVDVALDGPASPQSTTVTSISSLGLRVYSSGDGTGGIALGYARETIAVVPPNGCVDLSAPGPCAAGAAQSAD